MFDGVLPSNINVYATTAADPSESSYACYYDEKRMTYLGDRYSVSWLEDSDKVRVLLQKKSNSVFQFCCCASLRVGRCQPQTNVKAQMIY